MRQVSERSMRSAPRSGRTERRPSAKGTATMKLTTFTNISVDGVTQAHRRLIGPPGRGYGNTPSDSAASRAVSHPGGTR